MGFASPHVDFLRDGEADIFSDVLRVLWTAWFPMELVTWESDYLQAFLLVLDVERLQLRVLCLRVVAGRGDVDY